MKQMVKLSFVLFFFLTLTICKAESEKQEIKKTLKFTAGEKGSRSLIVDNISGSITVTGYDGDEVQLVVHETISGESDSRIADAKKEVSIETNEDGDRIRIYVDGPWRRSDGSTNYRGYDYYGYEVLCDFELKVPRKTNVRLKTVNDGAIKVTDVEGKFDVSNVNGNVRMADISGSGKAHTVNGDIEVSFKTNPLNESSFKTVNGEIDVKFQENLQADLEFSTMNGEVYSDFNVKSIPTKSKFSRKHNGMKVYKRGDSFSMRVGEGGPEISLNTLNGDITVAKYE